MKKITVLLFMFITITSMSYGQVIISQYYEGAGSDKWIELCNVGSTTIELTSPQLYLGLFANAAADNPAGSVANNNSALVGSLIPGEVVLFKNSSAVLPGYASGTSLSACNFNGDDLLVISTSSSNSTGDVWSSRIDVIGNGTSWGSNKSFYRNASITVANTTYTTAEWTQVTNAAVNGASSTTSEYLGTHLITGFWKTSASTTTWSTGANWDDVNEPSSSTNVYIRAGGSNFPSISGDATTPSESNNLTIALSASVTIPVGKALTVNGILSNSGTLTINATSSGTGSLKHQTDNVEATVEQYVAKDDTWHFLSVPFSSNMPAICDGNYAPVTGDFNSTVGGTYDFYYLDESEASDNWINIKLADTWGVNTTDFGNPPTFVAAKGYLVAYSSSFAGSETKSATANLSNGTVSIGLTVSNLNYNLIGNPYPSSIDWKASSGWTRDNIGEQDGYNLWVWNGTAGQFGAYNSTSDLDDGTNGASRYIAPSQGFYVKATSASNLIMDNDVRVHSSKKLLKNTESVDVVKLSVTGNQNTYSDEIIIEFGHNNGNGGTEKLNSMYAEAPSLTTTKNGSNFSLDFRSEPSVQSTIPVNFKAGVNGIYTFTSQLSASIDIVVLEDLLLDIEVELNSNTEYTFTSSPNDNPNRFILHFGPTGINNTDLSNNQIQIYSSNNTVQVINNKNLVGDISIINLFGQVVGNYKLTGNTKQQIDFTATTGLYIVSVKADNGLTSTKKVYIK